MNEGTASESTHDLLLSLAGRVDDDMLAWAGELVAVGEDTRAVELLTASLVADAAVLPEPVRAAVVASGRAARIDLDADAALPPSAPEEGTPHRFAPAPPGTADVAAVVRALPARQLQGCRVQLTWRLTPAGGAPGTLPHPVVLVEVEPGARPGEVLAYQLAVALDRAGVRASVEVLTAGRPLPAYHAAALRNTSAIRTDPEHTDPEHLERREQSDQYDDLFHRDLTDRGQPADHEVRGDHSDHESDQPEYAEHPEPLFDSEHRHPLAGPRPSPRPVEQAPRPAPAPPRPTPVSPAPGSPPPATPPATPSPAPLVPEPVDEQPPVAPPTPPRPTPAVVRESPEQEQEQDDRLPAVSQLPPLPTPVEHRPPTPIRLAPEPGGRRRKVTPIGDAEPAPRPAPRPIPNPSGQPRRPTVTPISRAALPAPVPLVRRDGPAPVAQPLTPAAESTPEPAPEPEETRSSPETAEQDWQPTLAETPAFAGLQDPLSGPLNEPLLDPLLDPTIHQDDPLGIGRLLPAAEEPAHEGTPAEDSWAAEWASGSWAMESPALREVPLGDPVRNGTAESGAGKDSAGTDRANEDSADDPGDERSDGPEDTADEVPAAGRRAARHRYADEPADEQDVETAAHEDDHDGHEDEHDVPEPDGADDGPAAPEDRDELRLRPESLARLSDADRQLLARLQAELVEGRRPRVSRRAGIGRPTQATGGVQTTNGSVHPHGSGGTNGKRPDPPDLAG